MTRRAKGIYKNLNLSPTQQRVYITRMFLEKKDVHITAYDLEKMLINKQIFYLNYWI